MLGIAAAALALGLSRVPWNGPIAGGRVGRVDGAWVLNPTFQQLEFSDADIVVAGSRDSIMMVEGSALELPEDVVADALAFAQRGIAEIVAMQEEIIREAGVPKMEWTRVEPPADLVARVHELAAERAREALNLPEKSERAQALAALRATVAEQLAPEFPDNAKDIGNALDDIEYTTMRTQVLAPGQRIDGRALVTVRHITCDVGILPRAHGSALFTRGQTQGLVSTTLGTVSDEQRIDTVDVAQETTKSFMLHYNFPPFSTGEVRPVRGVSRREIGHGALAERALQALLPPYEAFPYTIRVVSDILESNGSSSMATVGGGSLALLDAGVARTGGYGGGGCCSPGRVRSPAHGGIRFCAENFWARRPAFSVCSAAGPAPGSPRAAARRRGGHGRRRAAHPDRPDHRGALRRGSCRGRLPVDPRRLRCGRPCDARGGRGHDPRRRPGAGRRGRAQGARHPA